VRQALYYATDKETMIDPLYYDKYASAELPGAILKTNSQYYTEDYTKYTYDKEKAKALLTEAGRDCNKEADKALNDADIIVSVAKRKAAYAPLFKAWTTEVPVIPLWVNAVPVAARTGFKNYKCGPTSSALCAWNAWEWELTK